MLKKWQRPTVIREKGRRIGSSSNFWNDALEVIQSTFDRARGKGRHSEGYIASSRREGSVEAFPLLNTSSIALPIRNNDEIV